MSDFLASMARSSRARAVQAKQRENESELRTRALGLPNPPTLRLHPGGFDLIAEVKRRAPSGGSLAEDASTNPGLASQQADAYVRGGAAAVSVLTEPERFGGSLADLTAAARAVPIPVLRKDFLVDPYQVIEARAAGAGGVLIIVRMLDDVRLGELLDAAREMRLFVLLEGFDKEDLARAAEFASGAPDGVLLGLNTRNLSTLEVDQGRLEQLSHHFPHKLPLVAESGLASAEDIKRVARLGYNVALVGSALMKAAEPTKLAATMIQAGREEAMQEWASA